MDTLVILKVSKIYSKMISCYIDIDKGGNIVDKLVLYSTLLVDKYMSDVFKHMLVGRPRVDQSTSPYWTNI